MKRLILFRHAKTERRAPSGDDFDRRLTARGVSDARLMGEALAAAGFSPDVALVSPAARAKETWETASASFPAAVMMIKVGLYSADAAEILRLAEGRTETCVMVIAHNPSLHVLALELWAGGEGGARLAEGFPTASAAVFDLSGPRPALLGLMSPRDHGGGGDDESL